MSATQWDTVRGRIVKRVDGSVDIFLAVVGKYGHWAAAEARIGKQTMIERDASAVREALNSLTEMLEKVEPR